MKRGGGILVRTSMTSEESGLTCKQGAPGAVG